MVMPMLQPREKIHWGNLFCRMYGLPSMMLSISTRTTSKTINKIPMATSIAHNITLNLNTFMKLYCNATNAHFWPVDSWSQGQVGASDWPQMFYSTLFFLIQFQLSVFRRGFACLEEYFWQGQLNCSTQPIGFFWKVADSRSFW